MPVMVKATTRQRASTQQPSSPVSAASIHTMPMPIPPVPFAPPPPVRVDLQHPLVGVEPALKMFGELRRFRDSRAFEPEGCHCFREWAMKHFGEKMGAWLDDTL